MGHKINCPKLASVFPDYDRGMPGAVLIRPNKAFRLLPSTNCIKICNHKIFYWLTDWYLQQEFIIKIVLTIFIMNSCLQNLTKRCLLAYHSIYNAWTYQCPHLCSIHLADSERWQFHRWWLPFIMEIVFTFFTVATLKLYNNSWFVPLCWT